MYTNWILFLKCSFHMFSNYELIMVTFHLSERFSCRKLNNLQSINWSHAVTFFSRSALFCYSIVDSAHSDITPILTHHLLLNHSLDSTDSFVTYLNGVIREFLNDGNINIKSRDRNSMYKTEVKVEKSHLPKWRVGYEINSPHVIYFCCWRSGDQLAITQILLYNCACSLYSHIMFLA